MGSKMCPSEAHHRARWDPRGLYYRTMTGPACAAGWWWAWGGGLQPGNAGRPAGVLVAHSTPPLIGSSLLFEAVNHHHSWVTYPSRTAHNTEVLPPSTRDALASLPSWPEILGGNCVAKMCRQTRSGVQAFRSEKPGEGERDPTRSFGSWFRRGRGAEFLSGNGSEIIRKVSGTTGRDSNAISCKWETCPLSGTRENLAWCSRRLAPRRTRTASPVTTPALLRRPLPLVHPKRQTSELPAIP